MGGSRTPPSRGVPRHPRPSTRDKIDVETARRAVRRLTQAAITTVATAPLLDRVWELRANLSGYDAAYVAAAEHLGVCLVTTDRRLAAAPGPRCPISMP